MFVIEIPFFDLQKTFETSQCLRWKRLKEGMFVVIYRDKALRIEQQKQRFILNCSADEFYDIWFNYFDVVYDYSKVNREVKRFDNYFHIVAVKEQGVRIINQDLFEVLVKEILTDKIEESKKIEYIEKMCRLIGTEHNQSMKEAGKVKWFEFPNPVQLKENQEILVKIFGEDKVEDLFWFLEEDFDKIVKRLSNKDDYCLHKKQLKEFEIGLSRLGIERTCLMALGHKEAFVPNDLTHDILKERYDLVCSEFTVWYDEFEYFRSLLFEQIRLNEKEQKEKEIWV